MRRALDGKATEAYFHRKKLEASMVEEPLVLTESEMEQPAPEETTDTIESAEKAEEDDQ